MRKLTVEELRDFLIKLNYRGYGAYKLLKNKNIEFDYGNFELTKVQADPYAPPSYVEVVIPRKIHNFDKKLLDAKNIKPFTDFLARILFRSSLRFRKKCGSGHSCYIGIPKPSPRILKRSCVEVIDEKIVLRIHVGLPGKGRRVDSIMAVDVLTKKLPKIVKETISIDEKELWEHIEVYLDQEFLRSWIKEKDLMFFIANGSILPRESSLSQNPLKDAIPFMAPKSLEMKVDLPSGRRISGMGIPKGLTVITGGGYHGKTTLLEAIQEGIYDHVKGDGREGVISREYTIFVKAEDGRLVSHVDISSFIRNLPSKEDTTDYSSLDASGSTSMAASINEAIELKAEQILMDEDTSATNLLYKDEIMERIIRNEPIRPLSSQIRDMIGKTGAGITIITSASSAFIKLADRVILMDNYVPKDITGKDGPQKTEGYLLPRPRRFLGIKGLKKVKASGYKLVFTYFNGEKFELDLTQYPRIVEKGQVRFASEIIKKLPKARVSEIPGYINEKFSKYGFSAFIKPVPPDLTEVDGFDVAWILNRLYRAEFRQS